MQLIFYLIQPSQQPFSNLFNFWFGNMDMWQHGSTAAWAAQAVRPTDRSFPGVIIMYYHAAEGGSTTYTAPAFLVLKIL